MFAGSNRTLLELKFYCVRIIRGNERRSNRTLLELKSAHIRRGRQAGGFQSYHTGIEMKNKDGKNQ